MRSKKEELAARKRKKKNKGIDALIVLVFIILAGSVIWIGVNGLSKDRASDVPADEKESSNTFEEVDDSLKSDTALEENDKTAQSDEKKGAEHEPLRKSEDESISVEIPDNTEKLEESTEEKTEAEKSSNPIGYIEGQELPNKPKFVDGVLLANKQYPLPADYAPDESKEARAEFEKLVVAAKAIGINLQAFSTYRPYDYQVTLYERYVERDGQKAADRYSARPGYSEHQTGLAFDIGEVNREKHWASNSFGDTEAAKWLAANAYKYGFILRYPEGKEEITGYMHESWHYRYVGKDMSEKIFKQNITLEEYLGVR